MTVADRVNMADVDEALHHHYMPDLVETDDWDMILDVVFAAREVVSHFGVERQDGSTPGREARQRLRLSLARLDFVAEAT